jgi:hypothetical protein
VYLEAVVVVTVVVVKGGGGGGVATWWEGAQIRSISNSLHWGCTWLLLHIRTFDSVISIPSEDSIYGM